MLGCVDCNIWTKSVTTEQLDSSTYWILFVLDLRVPSWNFVGKTTNIVAKVFLIVNSIHRFAQTACLTSGFVVLEWTNVQSVAQ